MENDDKLKEVLINYCKTPSYRVYFADGIFGGLTPKDELFMEFYVERLPTPDQMTYSVKEDGTLGDPVSSQGKTGLQRELQCGLVMNMDTVIAFRNWLNRKIGEFNERVKSVEAKDE